MSGSAIRDVVLASRNADKVRELKQLCEGMPFRILCAEDFPGLPDVIEDGTTVLGNATRKAIVTAAYTGEISIADDTSLEVRVLNGLPGVFAARFSGPEATYESNAQLVLELLRDVPEDHRQARFATAGVWMDPRPGSSCSGAPTGTDFPVQQPAVRRWMHNPWARSITLRDTENEETFWSRFIDRDQVWDAYRARIANDLVDWGQDRVGVAGIAARLIDSVGTGEGLRIPDPRIWTVGGPDTGVEPRTRVAPSGLDPEAPGRGVNENVWLEISASGRVLGDVGWQALGSQGFGYDPIFVPAGQTRTLAEFEDAEKNAISHRGQAFRRLIRAARAAYGV